MEEEEEEGLLPCLLDSQKPLSALRTANKNKLKRCPKALESVYAVLMIDLLSLRLTKEEYSKAIFDVEPYRLYPWTVEHVVETATVYQLASVLAFLIDYPVLDSKIDRTIAAALGAISSRTLRLLLGAKIHCQWPDSEYHLVCCFQENPWKLNRKVIDRGVQRLTETKGLEDNSMLSSIFILFLFIANRPEYYQLVESNRLPMADDLFAVRMPKQLSELERALVMCPLPWDELDARQLRLSLRSFQLRVKETRVFLLTELVSANCWPVVDSYICTVENKIKTW